MGTEQLFAVATEFRFDVGQALLGTQQLTNAVDGLNNAATGAMSSLNYLASGLVAHLGLGSGGLLGILTRAFQTSEEFTRDSLNMTANIATNFQYLTGTVNGFNEQLSSSRTLLDDMHRVALNSGLSGHEIANVVRVIASPMAKHERLGHNYAGGINMAKNMMLAGESTGIGSRVMSETIGRALTDNMSIHGSVFQRLVGTQAFTAAKITNQGQLQHMEGGKKIDLLTKALEQLAGGAQYTAYRLNMISVQFTILKENLIDVLKPIGDAIIIPLRKIFKEVNSWLAANGPALGQAIGKMITKVFGDPEALYLNIKQLMNFKRDFHMAVNVTSKAIMFAWLGSYLSFTKGMAKAVSNLFGLGNGLGFMQIFSSDAGMLWKAFQLLRTLFIDFLPNVVALTYFFQILSRAKAKAAIIDAKEWITLSPRILNAITKMQEGLSNLFLPITMSIEAWSDWLAIIFTTTIWIRFLVNIGEALASIFQFLGNSMVALLSDISGVMAVMIGFMNDIVALKNPFAHILENFKMGWAGFMKDHPASGNGNTPSPLTKIDNHNHIEARFDMREQLEPDRVAFAVTEHLKKLAINATQGPNSMHQAYGRMLEASPGYK